MEKNLFQSEIVAIYRVCQIIGTITIKKKDK